MQGYYWAQTVDGALLVVLMVDGKGFVPSREDAIELEEIFILAPVEWPKLDIPQSPISVSSRLGGPAPAAARGSHIRLCVANG